MLTPVVCVSQVIAVHTGANNIPRDGADQVLEKLEDLCGKILHANPRYVYLYKCTLYMKKSTVHFNSFTAKLNIVVWDYFHIQYYTSF